MSDLGGRPAHYETVADLEAKIKEYFESVSYKNIPDPDNPDQVIHQGEPITVTGLAYFLGFESRQSFYDYEKREGFSYIIKKARLKVESEYEKKLSSNSPTGSIFALKNMGWKDSQEIKHHIPKGILNIDPLADDTANDGDKEDS